MHCICKQCIPRQPTDHWHITIFIYCIADIHCNATDSFEIVWGCNREACLDDVHSKLG